MWCVVSQKVVALQFYMQLTGEIFAQIWEKQFKLFRNC